MKDPEDYDPEKDGDYLVNSEPLDEGDENWDDEPNDEFLK